MGRQFIFTSLILAVACQSSFKITQQDGAASSNGSSNSTSGDATMANGGDSTATNGNSSNSGPDAGNGRDAAVTPCQSHAECDDDNVCTDDSCDNGQCVNEYNTIDCNDGNKCTENDVCSQGVCDGDIVVCFDDDECTDDACVPQLGCVFTENNAPCNAGGDACMDLCNAGVCVPSECDPCADETRNFGESDLDCGGRSVWINEIHYDDEGTDQNEGIEIAGPAGVSVQGWSLVLYNGNGGTVYRTIDLSGTFTDQSNGVGTLWFGVPTNGIQNDDEAIALVDCSGEVVQYIGYGGDVTATEGVALGMVSDDIGITESSNTADGTSLQLVALGKRYSDFVWAGGLTATPGQPNEGQTFIPMCDACGLNDDCESTLDCSTQACGGPRTCSAGTCSAN